MDGWMGWMDGWMDGWLVGWLDGCVRDACDGWMDGWNGWLHDVCNVCMYVRLRPAPVLKKSLVSPQPATNARLTD